MELENYNTIYEYGNIRPYNETNCTNLFTQCV